MSNVIVQRRSVPYECFEFYEDVDSLNDGYKRLDELEEEEIRKGTPSDVNIYRLSWKED